MKTKLIALIIIGVVLFGSFSFVYALMYDCLNPPAWIKMPKSDIRYCLGLLANGHLPDFPTWEEYLASKETRPEPDTGEFRYGQQECHYTDANGEQNFCVVEGWTKPASELDCEEICKSPPTKE